MPYGVDRGNESDTLCRDAFSAKKNVSRETLPSVSKRKNNLSRAKETIWELAVCNSWQYFVTLTLSPEKVKDRSDIKGFMQRFRKLVASMNAPLEDGRPSRPFPVKYLLVPERHKDGAWHFHGFLSGLIDSPLYDIRINRNGFREWRQYADKFGFMNMSEIRDIRRAASYTKKYITKDLGRSMSDLHSHLFYASIGLRRAEIVYRGCAEFNGAWSFEHPDGFCKVADLTSDEVQDPGLFRTVLPKENLWCRGSDF